VVWRVGATPSSLATKPLACPVSHKTHDASKAAAARLSNLVGFRGAITTSVHSELNDVSVVRRCAAGAGVSVVEVPCYKNSRKSKPNVWKPQLGVERGQKLLPTQQISKIISRSPSIGKCWRKATVSPNGSRILLRAVNGNNLGTVTDYRLFGCALAIEFSSAPSIGLTRKPIANR
jgi:hypothetical protein